MVILALTLTLAATQPDRSAADTRDLERIEQQLAATWKTGDCSGWAAFVAPEWSVIHITGDVLTKAQAVQMCQAPGPRIETMTVDDVSVRAFDSAAVVTGRTTVVTSGPSAETIRLRFTDVFIRRDGRWQVVASHATQLANQ